MRIIIILRFFESFLLTAFIVLVQLSVSASPVSRELKEFMLEYTSFASCRLINKNSTPAISRQYMSITLNAAINKFSLTEQQQRELEEWMNKKSTLKAAAKLAATRSKHGRGAYGCSMEGDRNWNSYVKRIAGQT